MTLQPISNRINIEMIGRDADGADSEILYATAPQGG